MHPSCSRWPDPSGAGLGEPERCAHRLPTCEPTENHQRRAGVTSERELYTSLPTSPDGAADLEKDREGSSLGSLMSTTRLGTVVLPTPSVVSGADGWRGEHISTLCQLCLISGAVSV